jgi:hypothetical protein
MRVCGGRLGCSAIGNEWEGREESSRGILKLELKKGGRQIADQPFDYYIFCTLSRYRRVREFLCNRDSEVRGSRTASLSPTPDSESSHKQPTSAHDTRHSINAITRLREEILAHRHDWTSRWYAQPRPYSTFFLNSSFVPTPPSHSLAVAYAILHTPLYWYLFFPCPIPCGPASLHTNECPHPQARHNQPCRLRTQPITTPSPSSPSQEPASHTTLIRSCCTHLSTSLTISAFLTPRCMRGSIPPQVMRPRLLLQCCERRLSDEQILDNVRSALPFLHLLFN